MLSRRMPYSTDNGFGFWDVVAFLVWRGITVRVCHESEACLQVSKGYAEIVWPDTAGRLTGVNVIWLGRCH